MREINTTEFFSRSLYFLFFLPLLGSSIVGYVFITLSLLIFLINKKLSKPGIAIAILFFVLIFYKFQQLGDVVVTEVLVRYFLGEILILCFLYYTKAKVNIDKLIKLYAIEVCIEALLINTILPPSFWPNYPNLDIAVGHQTHFMGFYQRVYSVGCNATVSSTIMCILASYRQVLIKKGVIYKNIKIEYLIFIAICLFASGTGFCLYLLYLLYKFNLYKSKYLAIGVVFVIGLLYATTFMEQNDSLFSRFSYMYMEFLWEFKSQQIQEAESYLEAGSYLIGTDYKNLPLQLWGDFAIRDFIISWGFAGLIFFLLLVLKYINRLNAFVLILGIIGIFHYGGIFSFSGQLVFSYAMLLNKKSIGYYA